MKARSCVLLITGMLLWAPVAGATGLLTCESGPETGWKPAETLSKQLVTEGWTVRRVKVDGGCYEVYGTTPEGDRVEAYFHPVSFEKLLVARRGEILYRKGS